VAIVLHGITGPLTVGGHRYEGAMPTFRDQLSDAEIAALLTHVRSQWGNQAAPIGAHGVAAVRKATAARSAPFNGEAELATFQ
jgi:mono/diheme cytochrome c family protein